ncbi:hypothetical protein MLD38_035302 [Melastoma candidum]|uniref:Uncharacterized protein n=1 Tax=Melastoma candidum TaxID=119954 RepID=A0ACB9MET7_9MYRT|nr:hypothetical protein MLD38_035302 [Melastoma candidum]
MPEGQACCGQPCFWGRAWCCWVMDVLVRKDWLSAVGVIRKNRGRSERSGGCYRWNRDVGEKLVVGAGFGRTG